MNKMINAAQAFRARLDRVKQSNPPNGFTWYGYDILSNVNALDGLLTDSNRELFDQIAGGRIADIGAADGDLGFFLESQGFQVDMVDNPATNWNGMRAIYALHEGLQSNARVLESDLDTQFRMPAEQYDLVIFLGILYHLKNPYYVLEHLAEVSQRLILSTRIAAFTRAGGNRVESDSVAYLLGPDECNNDATNFWIFSRQGLQRLVERTGWQVRDFVTFGDNEASNPQDNEHDQRAFMYLERAS